MVNFKATYCELWDYDKGSDVRQRIATARPPPPIKKNTPGRGGATFNILICMRLAFQDDNSQYVAIGILQCENGGDANG